MPINSTCASAVKRSDWLRENLLRTTRLTAQVKPDQMKNTLTKIDDDGMMFQGTLPPQISHTQLPSSLKAPDHPIPMSSAPSHPSPGVSIVLSYLDP